MWFSTRQGLNKENSNRCEAGQLNGEASLPSDARPNGCKSERQEKPGIANRKVVLRPGQGSGPSRLATGT